MTTESKRLTYSENCYSFDEYSKIVSLHGSNVKIALQKETLEESLELFSYKGLSGQDLSRTELLRDFIIQNDLERIMSSYSGETSFSTKNVRVGRGMCGRPSINVVSIAKTMKYCEEIYLELSDPLITDDRQRARSVMGILILAIESGKKINLEFLNIQNSEEARDSFIIDARKLLYGFMCEDLNDFIRSESPYPLLTSEGLRILKERIMSA